VDLGADYNPGPEQNPDRIHLNLDSIPPKSKCRADLRPNPDFYLAADKGMDDNGDAYGRL
jgi:hypothetical protein